MLGQSTRFRLTNASFQDNGTNETGDPIHSYHVTLQEVDANNVLVPNGQSMSFNVPASPNSPGVTAGKVYDCTFAEVV